MPSNSATTECADAPAVLGTPPNDPRNAARIFFVTSCFTYRARGRAEVDGTGTLVLILGNWHAVCSELLPSGSPTPPPLSGRLGLGAVGHFRVGKKGGS